VAAVILWLWLPSPPKSDVVWTLREMSMADGLVQSPVFQIEAEVNTRMERW
jgi:hypothetical protein